MGFQGPDTINIIVLKNPHYLGPWALRAPYKFGSLFQDWLRLPWVSYPYIATSDLIKISGVGVWQRTSWRESADRKTSGSPKAMHALHALPAGSILRTEGYPYQQLCNRWVMFYLEFPAHCANAALQRLQPESSCKGGPLILAHYIVLFIHTKNRVGLARIGVLCRGV